jgi:hypothetical protein
MSSVTEGATDAIGEYILQKNRAMGRKVKPNTDVTNTALGKREMAVRLWAIQDEEPHGGSNVTRCLKARIVEPEEMSFSRQRLGKQVSAATDTQATKEELLGTMFSVRSMRSSNKRTELVNWCSVGSWAAKRRLYVCCSETVIVPM